jgi:hypothetical protein
MNLEPFTNAALVCGACGKAAINSATVMKCRAPLP